MNPAVNGLISLYAAIFLLAGNGYFAKQIDMVVFDITAYRAALAAIALFAFLALFNKKIRLQSGRHYALSVALAGLLGVHWVAYFHSMRISTVALGMTILYTYPIITIFLERAVFKKAIRLVDVGVAIMVLIGIVLMVFPNPDAALETSDSNLQGVLTGLLSAFCFSCRNVFQQRYFRGYPAYQTIFYQVFIIAVVFLPFASVGVTELAQMPSKEWGMLVLLGIVFTAMPHSLLANSLRTISAKSVALIGCAQPVIGAGIALVLLSEIPSMQVIIGALIVLSGAIYETVKPAKVS